jgi:NADH-quinone oxidoreductase subunit E
MLSSAVSESAPTAPAPTAPATSSASSLVTRPSVLPRPPAATPPPPPLRQSASPIVARSPTQMAGSVATAQLEQRLAAAQLELRKLGSERHSLRARLRSESDRVHELESALRAEKELRRQAADEHQGAVQGLRARLAELESEKDQALATLSAELGQARSSPARSAGAPPAVKTPLGLRRIRGSGPAFQRALEQLGVTRVEQIAAWSAADVAAFAEKLKIRPDRIGKDDWVGQARQLEPER